MIDLVTRRVEFDAGHRIPSHKSKCRNMHGHRYVLEATVQGIIQPVRAQSDDGMILDFGDLKDVMNRTVAEPWDHAFLVYQHDKVMVHLLGQINALENEGRDPLGKNNFVHKTVVLPCVPTVENLARIAFNLISAALPKSMLLHHVRLYETPNCWGDATC